MAWLRCSRRFVIRTSRPWPSMPGSPSRRRHWSISLCSARPRLLFRAIWQRPFWQAIHWNAPAVAKRWIPLLGAGLVLGLLNGAASNLLPMPKEAPILNDLMRSTTGAWLMFLFGTTLAPLMEEIAFRGFLLPSLINFFRWLSSPQSNFPTTSSRLRLQPTVSADRSRVDPAGQHPLRPSAFRTGLRSLGAGPAHRRRQRRAVHRPALDSLPRRQRLRPRHLQLHPLRRNDHRQRRLPPFRQAE